MKRNVLLRVVSLIFIFLPGLTLCQVNPMSISGVDSLKKHQVAGSLFLGFDFTQDAMQYLYLSFSGSGLYVDKRNTYGRSVSMPFLPSFPRLMFTLLRA